MFYRSAEVIPAMRFSGSARRASPGSSRPASREAAREARRGDAGAPRARAGAAEAGGVCEHLRRLAAVAFLAGVIAGAAPSSSSSAHTLAARFATAWARGDYERCTQTSTWPRRRELSASDFAADYRQTALTATTTRQRVTGSPRDVDAPTPPAGVTLVAVPVRVQTRLFGTLSASFTLPVRGERRERARGVVARAAVPRPALRRAAHTAHLPAPARPAAGA